MLCFFYNNKSRHLFNPEILRLIEKKVALVLKAPTFTSEPLTDRVSKWIHLPGIKVEGAENA